MDWRELGFALPGQEYESTPTTDMTTTFISWLQGIVRPLKLWATVKPWEQGLRVRIGKHVEVLNAGLHWKWPLLDTVTVLPIRVRVATVPTLTAMTKDGKAVTVGMAFQYQIEDLERVFRSVHHPDQTVMYWIQGSAGELVRSLDSSEIEPGIIRDRIMQELAGRITAMGFGQFRVFVTDIALVRTFRLIQDGRWTDDSAVDTLGRDA